MEGSGSLRQDLNACATGLARPPPYHGLDPLRSAARLPQGAGSAAQLPRPLQRNDLSFQALPFQGGLTPARLLDGIHLQAKVVTCIIRRA